jgi:Protein of unknown function (DUF3455)
MKTRASIALGLVSMLLFVACGTTPTSSQVENTTSTRLLGVGLGPISNPLFQATQALVPSIPQYLPNGVPSALLNVSATGLNGISYSSNIASILNSPTFPSARITAALRTGYTPASSNALLSGRIPTLDSSSPAAQVYQCQQTATGTAWTFIRPEAGLTPINGSIPTTISFEHFLYPGYASVVPSGPAWRLETSDGAFQDLFVGQRQASAPSPGDPTGAIPWLRLIRTNSLVASQPAVDSNVGTLLFPHPVETYTANHGIFRQEYLFRLETQGGIAPSSGCSSTSDVGKLARSIYAADYYFVEVAWAAY